MQTMLDDLTNGNLQTAKAQAKRFSHRGISIYCQEDRGMSLKNAVATADYLKGLITFQEYCDITFNA